MPLSVPTTEETVRLAQVDASVKAHTILLVSTNAILPVQEESEPRLTAVP